MQNNKNKDNELCQEETKIILKRSSKQQQK